MCILETAVTAKLTQQTLAMSESNTERTEHFIRVESSKAATRITER